MKRFLMILTALITLNVAQAQDELQVKRVGNFDADDLKMDSMQIGEAPKPIPTFKEINWSEFRESLILSNIDLQPIIFGDITDITICFPIESPIIVDTSFNKYIHLDSIKTSLSNYLQDPVKVWAKEYQKVAKKLDASQAENHRLKLYISLAFIFNLLLGIWVLRRFAKLKT
ncbi:hypothetical protein BKI52_05835 [marine bacterium AO1-C]|nr:hypothetical protein BKI52_05835 [marine bacterium AO1-C]